MKINIFHHLKFFKFIIKHKWFVMIECFKYGLYWRGLVHDNDKFYFDEWFDYVRVTYDGSLKRDETGYYNPLDVPGFLKVWFLHQKRSEHHWQYWILPDENNKIRVLPMSEKARLEMVCDWYGASRAHNRGGWEGVKKWYAINKDKLTLHEETRKKVEKFLEEK